MVDDVGVADGHRSAFPLLEFARVHQLDPHGVIHVDGVAGDPTDVREAPALRCSRILIPGSKRRIG